MNAKLEPADPLVDAILADLQPHLSATQKQQARIFVSEFFHRVSADDVAIRASANWAALLRGLLEFISVRKSGAPSVRVFNPSLEHDGWESNHTIVQIVTADMPFLVDSVGIAAQQSKALLHSLIHPVYFIARDAGGHLLSLVADAAGKGAAESVMHAEIDKITEPAELEKLHAAIETALHDVALSVQDWPAMKQKMRDIADELGKWRLPLDAEGVAEAQEFLRWAADDHFTFLGYREYHVVGNGDDEVLEASPKSGLGILHKGDRAVAPRTLKGLVAHELRQSGKADAIIMTKTNARSTVHRSGHMDYIGVLEFDAKGKPQVEHRFLGLFASGAYSRRPWEIPLVRRKYEAVMDRSGLKRDSHSGKTLRNILETLPRDELFQSGEDDLFDTAMGIMGLQGRARSRLFVRRDKYGRFFSCLVFIPRDRFNTDVRERIEALLKRTLHGERLDSTIQIGESALARVHMVIRPKPGDKPKYDVAELETKIGQIVRNWHDELREILVRKHGEEKGSRLAHRYGKALPTGYIEEVTATIAANDVDAAAALKNADDIQIGRAHV